MEIIQTYESEGSEICVLSNGNTISFADKNDIAVESPKVGSVVKPSQMSEMYLEVPKELLQEIARRSEIHVDPDEEEEEEEEASDDDGEEDAEEDGPPDWETLALAQFMVEYAALEAGVEMNVLVNFPVKVSWVDGEHADWETTDGSSDLHDVLQARENLQNEIAAVTTRIRVMNDSITAFAAVQNDLGHDITADEVSQYLEAEMNDRKAAPVIADADQAAE